MVLDCRPTAHLPLRRLPAFTFRLPAIPHNHLRCRFATTPRRSRLRADALPRRVWTAGHGARTISRIPATQHHLPRAAPLLTPRCVRTRFCATALPHHTAYYRTAATTPAAATLPAFVPAHHVANIPHAASLRLPTALLPYHFAAATCALRRCRVPATATRGPAPATTPGTLLTATGDCH